MKKFFSKFLVIAMLFTLTIPSNIAFALGGDPETITLNDSNYNPGDTVTVTLLDNADDPVELPADWDLQFQAREGVTEVLVENFLLGGDITLNGENYEFVIDEDILNSFPSATHDYFVVIKDDADEEVTVEEFNISAPAGRRNVFGNLNVPEVVVQIPNPQYLLFDEDREENQNFTFSPGENLGVRLESNLGTLIESLPQNWKIETSNYNEVTGRKVTLGRYEGFEISRIVAPQNLDEYEISLYNSRGSLVHDRSFLVTNGQEPTTITLNKRVFLPGEDILANILLENGELSKNLPAGFTVELNKINGAETRNLITYNNRLNDYLDNLTPGQYQYRLIHNDEELSVTSFSIESGESFRIINVFNRNNPGDGIARVSVNPGQSFGIKLMDSELGMYHSWLPENYSILAEKTDLIANNVDERTLLIDTPGFIDNVSAPLEPGVYKMILLNEETQTTISSNNLLYVEEEVIYTPAYLLFAGEINNPNFAANFPSVNGSVILYFKIEDSNGTIHDAAPTREYEIEIYRTSEDGEEILMDNGIITGNGYINDLTGDIAAPAALLEPGEYVAVLKNLSTNQRSITRSFRIFERNQRINLENVNLGEEIANAAKEFNENRKNVVQKISNQENLEFFFEAEESNTCSDMDPNDWSYELVLNAIEMNIWPLREDAEGNIICQPHNGLTRGMAALLLVSYYYPETADQVGQINLQMQLGFLEMPFADVDLKNPLSSWIVASHGLGIFKGSPNLGGKPFFRPNDVINRAEFLALISRLNGFEDLNANDEGFNDINEEDWFNKSAKVGKALGLVKGYEGNNFKPDKGVSNAEAAKILQAASILSNGLKGKKIFETKDEKGAKEVVQEAVAEELLKFGRNIEDVKKAKVPDALVTGFLDEFQNGFSDRLKALGVDEEIGNKSGLGKGKKNLDDYLDPSRHSQSGGGSAGKGMAADGDGRNFDLANAFEMSEYQNPEDDNPDDAGFYEGGFAVIDQLDEDGNQSGSVVVGWNRFGVADEVVHRDGGKVTKLSGQAAVDYLASLGLGSVVINARGTTPLYRENEVAFGEEEGDVVIAKGISSNPSGDNQQSSGDNNNDDDDEEIASNDPQTSSSDNNENDDENVGQAGDDEENLDPACEGDYNVEDACESDQQANNQEETEEDPEEESDCIDSDNCEEGDDRGSLDIFCALFGSNCPPGLGGLIQAIAGGGNCDPRVQDCESNSVGAVNVGGLLEPECDERNENCQNNNSEGLMVTRQMILNNLCAIQDCGRLNNFGPNGNPPGGGNPPAGPRR